MAAERKRTDIAEKEFQVDSSTLISITISCGIGEFSQELDSYEHLIEKANKALLVAKSMGKNKSIAYLDL